MRLPIRLPTSTYWEPWCCTISKETAMGYTQTKIKELAKPFTIKVYFKHVFLPDVFFFKKYLVHFVSKKGIL